METRLPCRIKNITVEKMAKKIKTYSLDEVTDKFIGKKGTAKRELFEYELQMEIIGDLIKKTREERNLTQEELGKLIGVQKAQISKLESHTGNVTLATIVKVFGALKARLKFHLEFEEGKIKLA
jgi:HTH-type transcriptional regulator/antitoxin HipB